MADHRKTLLVTGATSDMGRAVALAAAGDWAVVATGRDEARLTGLSEAATQQGTVVDARRSDIIDHDAVAQLVDQVAAEYGRIDAVVNQAGGIAALGSLEQIPIAAFRATMETNFFGNIAVIQAVLPHLRTSGGHLVQTTSMNSSIGAPYNDAYAASKCAVEGLMPVAEGHGIKVTIY